MPGLILMTRTMQKRGSCDTTQPFLKWLGGKRALVSKHIKPIYNDAKPIGKVVEPFCGSLAVSLGLQPEHALLCDTNPYLINLYNVLAQGNTLTQAYDNTADDYYEARDHFNDLIAKDKWHKTKCGRIEMASLFYYINRHCFNGLIRFNSRGQFNAAYGKYKQTWYEPLNAYCQQFTGWTFVNDDFESLTDKISKSDFIYADPPYDTTFSSYTKDVFTWDDQVRLAEWLAAAPCTVVASNAGTTRIKALYQALGFEVKTVKVARSISCDGNREAATEMLAVKEGA
jgi:DNA adenine methylase